MKRKLADFQPDSFEFTVQNKQEAEKIIGQYPKGREHSAIIPLLTLGQNQNQGWVTRAMIETIGKMINMPFIRALEIATFYTMFNLAPVGKFHVQVCTTTPCMLRGAEKLVELCKQHIAKEEYEVSPDGLFSYTEVECMGVCSNAPMVQINEANYEDLNQERFLTLLDNLKNNKPVKVGPQSDRKGAEPFEDSGRGL